VSTLLRRVSEYEAGGFPHETKRTINKENNKNTDADNRPLLEDLFIKNN